MNIFGAAVKVLEPYEEETRARLHRDTVIMNEKTDMTLSKFENSIRELEYLLSRKKDEHNGSTISDDR